MQTEHLDHALAEEFAGHGEAIHRLKIRSPEFKELMVQNHALWTQIRNIQNGVNPADDAYLETLEKQRLAILDEIARMLAAEKA
jgi:uncharacterized protein YdcH (DUF465 family)